MLTTTSTSTASPEAVRQRDYQRDYGWIMAYGRKKAPTEAGAIAVPIIQRTNSAKPGFHTDFSLWGALPLRR